MLDWLRVSLGPWVGSRFICGLSGAGLGLIHVDLRLFTI